MDFDQFDLTDPGIAEVVQLVIEKYEAEQMAEDEAKDHAKPLMIVLQDGESQEHAKARTFLAPEVRAAMSLDILHRSSEYATDVNELVSELEAQTKAFQDKNSDRAESMLSAQSHTLDAMFHKLIYLAFLNIQGGYHDAGQDYLKLALRAQVQCKMTLEALPALKRPAIDGESEKLQTKLYRDDDEVDGEKPKTPKRVNPPLAAVETLDRAKVAKG